MGKSFHRNREDIYDGEFDDNAYQTQKRSKMQRRSAKLSKQHAHDEAFEPEDDIPLPPQFAPKPGRRVGRW